MCTMLVRMKSHITGTRDGVEWPPVGGTIDVPDHEAADLIHAGYAEEATDAKAHAAKADDGDTAGAAEPDGAADGDGDAAEADGSDDGTDHEAVDGSATEPTGKRAKKRAPRKARAAKKR